MHCADRPEDVALCVPRAGRCALRAEGEDVELGNGRRGEGVARSDLAEVPVYGDDAEVDADELEFA